MVDRIAAVAAVVTVVVVAVAAAEAAAVALALIVAYGLKHVVLQQYQEPVAIAQPVVRSGPAVLPIHRFPLVFISMSSSTTMSSSSTWPLARSSSSHPCFPFLLLLERKTLVRKDRRRPD